MRVAVTGATGFIGAHVARLLAERGAEVRVTHRDASRLSQLGDVAVTPVEADVLDRAALRRAFRGARLVFHGAGVVATRPAEMVWKVNALAPRLVVEAAAAEGAERVVITSSVGGVGPATAGPRRQRGRRLPRRRARADLRRLEARGRVRGARGRRALRNRGRRGQPGVRARRPREPLPAG